MRVLIPRSHATDCCRAVDVGAEDQSEFAIRTTVTQGPLRLRFPNRAENCRRPRAFPERSRAYAGGGSPVRSKRLQRPLQALASAVVSGARPCVRYDGESQMMRAIKNDLEFSPRTLDTVAIYVRN